MADVVSTHISEIPRPDYELGPGEAEWKPVRAHFGIESFGTNAYIARGDGDTVVGEHTEVDTRHEELYFVANGDATFTVGGETVEAPEGTFVFVRDPEVPRSAVAKSAGTTILGFGAEPGVPFTPSAWELKYTGD